MLQRCSHQILLSGYQNVKKLGFQCPECNGTDHRFNKEKKIAIKDWVINLFGRHSLYIYLKV
jgi:hypothetical protein